MTKLPITSAISIDEAELEERFVASPGPGGQNVNKVASAVQLRFDAANSPSLDEGVRARLIRLAGSRATNDGVIVIDAHRYRSQERNRADARGRLTGLIARAAIPPVKRKPTRPTLASKKRRLEGKKARGQVKKARAKPDPD